MHPALPALLGLVIALPVSLPAQEAFQGSITYRMGSDRGTSELTVMSRGSKARMEMAAPGMPGPMVMLMDGESMMLRLVMASAGRYMEMDMKQAARMVPEAQRSAAEGMAADGGFTKLETSDEIAGVRCQNYRFTAAGAPEMEACIATGMGYWMAGVAPPQNARAPVQTGPDFSRFMKDFKDGMMPLRVRTRQGDGWTNLMEATAIERKQLDPSLFEVPPGLQKMAMPGGPPR